MRDRADCRYFPKRGPGVPLRPWHDCPRCPDPKCGAPAGCLHPYNPSGWCGPQDATVFCPACGTGWYGTDAEIEQAMIAECWWDDYNRGALSEHAYCVREGGC